MTPPEFHLFLPQMRMDFPAMVKRSQAAERAGFDGLALMDHLAPPLAEGHAMHDAMVTASWLAASTSRLTIGHLVLCDAFRNPAVLAKQAVSLDHASDGRFELGLGWGSWAPEFKAYGLSTQPKDRFERLAETVDVVNALWSGEEVSYDGVYHQLSDAQQQPTPTRPIPVVIGGTGPKVLRLAAAHATWWNCPGYALDRFAELNERTGTARGSLQQMIAFVPEEALRDEVTSVTHRRFGANRADLLVGTGPELVSALSAQASAGVERFYIWMSDFASPETLEAFGAEVIAAFR